MYKLSCYYKEMRSNGDMKKYCLMSIGNKNVKAIFNLCEYYEKIEQYND